MCLQSASSFSLLSTLRAQEGWNWPCATTMAMCNYMLSAHQTHKNQRHSLSVPGCPSSKALPTCSLFPFTHLHSEDIKAGKLRMHENQRWKEWCCMDENKKKSFFLPIKWLDICKSITQKLEIFFIQHHISWEK